MNKKRIKPHTPPPDGTGRLYPPDTMFFRVNAGEATQDKRKYSLSTNVGGGIPIVKSEQTGKWFTLTWGDIITLAIAKGIDKP